MVVVLVVVLVLAGNGCRVCGVQIAQAPFQLTDDYTAPRGALIMPSITAAAMHVSPPPPPTTHTHTQL